MSTTPQKFEHVLADDLSADELISGKLDGTITDFRTDIHGRKWVKRPAKLPMIFSEPEGEITIHGGDDDSTAAGLARLRAAFAERESEPDEPAEDAEAIEAEMEEYRQDAIARIRAYGWGESPTSFEGGFDAD